MTCMMFFMLTDLLGLSEVLLVLLSPTLNRRLDGVGCTRANLGSCAKQEAENMFMLFVERIPSA